MVQWGTYVRIVKHKNHIFNFFTSPNPNGSKLNEEEKKTKNILWIDWFYDFLSLSVRSVLYFQLHIASLLIIRYFCISNQMIDDLHEWNCPNKQMICIWYTNKRTNMELFQFINQYIVSMRDHLNLLKRMMVNELWIIIIIMRMISADLNFPFSVWFFFFLWIHWKFEINYLRWMSIEHRFFIYRLAYYLSHFKQFQTI